MKKVLCLCLFLCACSPDDTIQGKTYCLENTPIPITLTFNAHDTSYFGTAVNRYFGTYRRDKTDITFTTLSSELRTASDNALDAEDAYFTHLKSVRTYDLKGPLLRLTTTDGAILTFHEQSPRF